MAKDLAHDKANLVGILSQKIKQLSYLKNKSTFFTCGLILAFIIIHIVHLSLYFNCLHRTLIALMILVVIP